MSEETYRYVIVGGGLAGAAAVEGIRERDGEGPVLLLGAERRPPYDRPPLSKALWSGKKKVEQITLHDAGFWERSGVRLALGREAASLDGRRKVLVDSDGRRIRYEKLLLATGGAPRRLPVPGADLPGVVHFRTLDDYLQLRADAAPGTAVAVIGGGFIGSELAASLRQNGVEVTMIFPGERIGERVFPPELGEAVTRDYRERGVRLLTGEKPAAIGREGERLVVRTESGGRVEADRVVVGIGIAPETRLAEGAGAEVGDGVVVDERLQATVPDVYAAGDNASFPYAALGKRTRVEHWDNAVTQGKWAGRNMAGAGEPYTHLPYFFSDLFDLGYEAVGEVAARLETFADWREYNRKGVVYYRKDGVVRGVLLVDVWERVEAARDLIRRGQRSSAEDLRGAIR